MKTLGQSDCWAANRLSLGGVPLYSDQRKATTETAGSIGFTLSTGTMSSVLGAAELDRVDGLGFRRGPVGKQVG